MLEQQAKLFLMKINVSQTMAHYPLVVKSIKWETIVCSDFFKEWNKEHQIASHVVRVRISISEVLSGNRWDSNWITWGLFNKTDYWQRQKQPKMVQHLGLIITGGLSHSQAWRCKQKASFQNTGSRRMPNRSGDLQKRQADIPQQAGR